MSEVGYIRLKSAAAGYVTDDIGDSATSARLGCATSDLAESFQFLFDGDTHLSGLLVVAHVIRLHDHTSPQAVHSCVLGRIDPAAEGWEGPVVKVRGGSWGLSPPAPI